ncbi:MAG TPA: PASTA domain-containing protein [Polyangiaceae bacterium]|jgi:serine/threonine-protein kinase|nr:PASTA domain-containing protein [Polyangiaceae bacterium]
MNNSTVFLIAFFTSLLTATGTVFVIQRTNILAAPQEVQVAVPNLKGLLEEDAMTNLRAAGLVMMISSREATADAKAGTVVRQAVPAGQNVAKGQAVAVTIADALPTVPDVAGRAFAEASMMLEQAGYRVQKGDPIADDKAPEGSVIKQLPLPGSPLDKGKAVLLQVSSGADTVEIPKVVGLTLSNAKTQLEKAGLKVGPVRWVYADEAGYMAVLNQEPKGGERSKPGAEIVLSVNRD